MTRARKSRSRIDLAHKGTLSQAPLHYKRMLHLAIIHIITVVTKAPEATMKHTILAERLMHSIVSLLASMALLGCSNSPGTVGGGGGGTDQSSGGGTTGGGTTGSPVTIYLPDASIGGGGGTGRAAGGMTGPAPTSDANCGVQTSKTTKVPTDVLLVLDRSGSMNESIAEDCCCTNTCRQLISIKICANTSNCAERWPALTSAVNTTITTTSGINWGLKLFSTRGASDSCSVSNGVEVGTNGGAAAVENAIAAASPLGSTPTAKAITAATAYLQTINDNNNKVILLATDGEPNCKPGSSDPSTPDVDGTTAALQAALAAGFKAYVIGIGPSVGNLDNFASAGGTGHYFPATSAADLANALAAISKAVSSCTFTMPQPPPDPNNIAVYVDGKLVAQDPADGWSFGATSQTVTINGSACSAITSGSASEVKVLFGCVGQAPPGQIY